MNKTLLFDHTRGRIVDHPSLVLHVDGACGPKNPGGIVTAGWVMFSEENIRLAEEGSVIQDGGALATNNVGEYSALCNALTFLVDRGWSGQLTVKADSKLVVEQMNYRWKCKAEHLRKLRDKAHSLLEELNLCIVNECEPLPLICMEPCQIVWVPREENEMADQMCRKVYAKYKEEKRCLS